MFVYLTLSFIILLFEEFDVLSPYQPKLLSSIANANITPLSNILRILMMQTNANTEGFEPVDEKCKTKLNGR